ncbi:MAG: MFS transporter [Pseudonocardiales bacterium]
MRRLMAHRDARIYLLGQVVSVFGDSLLTLAMAIWVKTLTGSNSAAGFVYFFFAAASLFAPAAGLLVDRLRRRRLLVVTNAVTAIAVLTLLLVDDAGQVWLIDLVMFAYGLSWTVLSPAQSALLTDLLPDDLLADANGALRTAQESLRLVGPLAGAGLFAAVGAHPIVIIDAITFVVPIICLLALRTDEPTRQPLTQHWRDQMIAGITHVWRTSPLRQAVIAAASAATVIGFDETIIFAVATNGLDRTPSFVGVLISIQGAGAVLGGPTAAALIRRMGEGRLMGLALVISAAGAALQIPPSLPSVTAGVALIGVSFPWLVIALVTLVQRSTPSHLQGRAYSAAATLITVPQTLSIAVGAALIGVTGYQPLLAIIAAVSVLAAIYLLSRPAQRGTTRTARHDPNSEARPRTARHDPNRIIAGAVKRPRRVLLVDRLGPHGGHAATETDRRKWRQPTSEVEEFRDIQRQWE